MVVRHVALKVLDSFFLLRIPLLVPVWTILLLGWITGSPDASIWSLSSSASGAVTYLWPALIGFSLVVASIYVVNQIVDIESDRINHKLFLLPHGIVSVRTAWVLALLCLGGGMAIGWMLGPGMLAIFVASVLLGVAYNLPPASLKNRAVGGVAANSLGHGMLTYLVGWYAAKQGVACDWSLLQTGLVSSLSPAFANGAVFLATTIPDAQGDSATGKQTFCVQYGKRATAVAAALFCVAALTTALLMEHNRLVMVVPSAISVMLFFWLAVSSRREVAFQAFRWPVVLLSLAVFMMVPVYGVMLACTFLASRAYYRHRFGIEYPTFKSK
ncbi:MAG: hypothetical protein GF331_20025 [Chitinivibrionales bacterium]|nr:hypothetical protein [Chitinivibrionales bacterium]